ncbi:hypothetical protein MHU86_1674 [Fragilaria crotonensis]|nr:hypothetical protein MHU86_1674 [Fragilaria crotonensis]
MSAMLGYIIMEIKNLIDHDTFILGQTPYKDELIDQHDTFILGQTPYNKDELIIPVKLVLKAKQTATGKLDKLKACLVARGDDLEKRLLKRVKAINQQLLREQCQEIAESTPSPGTPKPIRVEPLISEDTWSPCASARGVKLFIATICASRRSVKSADFIGAHLLQAKVIGCHFVKLPLEYANRFPGYTKFFGSPMLLNKGIYGRVYSGKYWHIEFSKWLYSQGFIQIPSEPSCFVQ